MFAHLLRVHEARSSVSQIARRAEAAHATTLNIGGAREQPSASFRVRLPPPHDVTHALAPAPPARARTHANLSCIIDDREANERTSAENGRLRN